MDQPARLAPFGRYDAVSPYFMSFALQGERSIVVGSDVPSLVDPLPAGNWLAILPRSGHRVAPPHGNFAFLHARVSIDSAGRIHLLWAEPAARPTEPTPIMSLIAASVWAASYSEKGGWTEPTRLLGRPTFWLKGAIDEIARSGDSLLLSASAGPSRAVFFYDGRNWSVRETRISGIEVASSSAFVRGVIVTAAIGALPGSPAQNGVILSRSVDYGTSWSSPRVLAAGTGETRAHEVRVRVDGAGTLHVVWLESTLQGLHLRLRHSASSDGGRTWSEIADLPLSQDAFNLQAVVDACARVHVTLMQLGTTGRAHVGHYVWDGDWSRGNPILLDTHVLDQSLAHSEGLVELAVLVTDPARPGAGPHLGVVALSR